VSGSLPGESAGADRFQDSGRRAETGRAACVGARAGHSASAAGEPACQALQAGARRPWLPRRTRAFSHDTRAGVALRGPRKVK
jgi:hypothetical protein